MYHLMTCSFFLSLGLCLLPIKSISVSLVAFLYFSFLLQNLSFSPPPSGFHCAVCLPSAFTIVRTFFLSIIFFFIICPTQIPQYVTFERIMGDCQEMKNSLILYFSIENGWSDGLLSNRRTSHSVLVRWRLGFKWRTGHVYMLVLWSRSTFMWLV